MNTYKVCSKKLIVVGKNSDTYNPQTVRADYFVIDTHYGTSATFHVGTGNPKKDEQVAYIDDIVSVQKVGP